jgi:hypothetical protein
VEPKFVALTVLLVPVFAHAQTADKIMARVAENQTRAETARAGFVYRQDVLVRLQRSDGKLAREEDREYTVTPEPDGVKREMVHFTGKYGVNGKEFPIAEPGDHYQDKDFDADLANSLADDFGGDEQSRDGINLDLFPLSAKKQKHYAFKLAGQENYRGHEVYRITFQPRPKSDGDDGTPWAGEALIDKTDMAPVLITTHLAHGVPLVVKTVFGTNLQQIGFKVAYEKFDDNLWFPVNYSGEMKVRLLFLYARTISMGLQNSGFQKADVKSAIVFEGQTN